MNRHLELPKLKDKYILSKPFPHIVVDDFVDSNLLEDIINEFDTYQSFGHDPNSTQFQVKKFFSPYSAENLKEMPFKTKDLIDYFNSEKFIFLTSLNLYSSSSVFSCLKVFSIDLFFIIS